MPVPRTAPISTKRSVCGSFSLLVIFVGYILYSLLFFILANYPKMNEYSVPLEDQVVPVPKMAFGFVEGKSLNYTNYDVRNFNFQFKMMRKY